jgi:CIC family chloride channel protein
VRLNINRLLSWAKAGKWTEQFEKREEAVSLLLSLVVGALVGLVITGFILLTGRLAARMYPPGGSAWLRVMVPTLGSLVSGTLIARFFPNARGSGIPQTKFALFIHDGYISLKTVIGKFLCCTLSLASGIALGREGPSVQIGSGLASVLGRAAGLRPASVRALIPVGSSAALAAAFNTPIAAVLFSLEEILGDLHAKVLGTVVISSATSWMVLHLILGDEPLFHVPAYHLVNPAEFGVYAVLGLVGGLGSVAFVKLLLVIRLAFKRLPASTLWLQPAAGGLFVGLLALAVPEVLGVGYDYVERVLGGDLALKTVVLLAVLKIVATATCYSSGNAGGIFGPSLFIGAMLGASVGALAHTLFPSITADPGAYALVGMGTAFAGIIRTPFTSVIMIFELTRDYSIIVPLMISNMIAYFVSQKLQREPIYDALARQEGVFLPDHDGEREEPEYLLVANVMRPCEQPFPPGLDVDAALAKMSELGVYQWPVARDGTLLGLVSEHALKEVRFDTAPAVRDALPPDRNYPFVHVDNTVGQVLERMGQEHVELLPVVSRANVRQLLGVITFADAVKAYGVGKADA